MRNGYDKKVVSDLDISYFLSGIFSNNSLALILTVTAPEIFSGI